MAIFSVHHRGARVAVALLIATCLYFSFISWRLHWGTDTNPRLSGTGQQISPPEGLNGPSQEGELVEDAHRLPQCDSFIPHFAAVRKMPGITMEEAKAGCTWPVMDDVNFQYSKDTDWVVHERNNTELATRRKEWHDFVANDMLPYSAYKDRFKGRGIIIVAGNGNTLKRVKVILRALKKLGSKLPIELHYWNDEMTEKDKKDISSMWPEMYFNDLSAPTNVYKTSHDNVFHINYQLKTAAVINSRFAEPLLLDSDNIPIIDPASLYETDIYQEYGTLFWPDIARTRPSNPMWAITNTACRMDEYEQESGQLIIDKRRFFYHLQLAVWFNNGPAQFYYSEFLLGDKDMFRFAWHALRTKYGAPPKWITSVGTLTDGYYCGHSFAQHHPDGRVAFLHGGLVKTMAKEVMRWHRKSRGGIYQVYKRSEFDEKPAHSVSIGIKFDAADYLPDRPKDLSFAMCTDMSEVATRPFDDLVPQFEKTFEEIGGYWILDD